MDMRFIKHQSRCVVLLQTQLRRFFARRLLAAAWKACVAPALLNSKTEENCNTVLRYFIETFYPGATVKMQAFARRIFNRSTVIAAEQRKLLNIQVSVPT